MCIELKSPTGRQSPAQREWQAAVEREGIAYAVVRSLDGFINAVEGYLTAG